MELIVPFLAGGGLAALVSWSVVRSFRRVPRLLEARVVADHRQRERGHGQPGA
jgi:hypothetical protein